MFDFIFELKLGTAEFTFDLPKRAVLADVFVGETLLKFNFTTFNWARDGYIFTFLQVSLKKKTETEKTRLQLTAVVLDCGKVNN